MAKIGFIGLGHMGLPMAKNLCKAGHVVTGFDLQNKLIRDLRDIGGLGARSVAETARNQDFVITMLQTGEQVLNVCQGDDGIFANANANMVYIDCSTIDVASSRNIHSLANNHNLMCVDAPVSGGVTGAETAALTFMVGGSLDAFNCTKPILQSMGQKIIHTGDAGSGQVAKICNNMLLGISMIASSEAFNLGKALGLNPQKLHEVVTNSSGQCWVMDKYVPEPDILKSVPANNNYKPGFSIAMMLKDLNLSQQSAQTAEVTTQLGNLAQRIYQSAFDDKLGELDFSAIIRVC